MNGRFFAVLLLACSLFVLLVACSSGTRQEPASLEPREGSEPGGAYGHRSDREKWFRQQRLFPFASIDEDLRAKAFRRMRQMERSREMRANAAGDDPPVWVSLGPAPTESRHPDNWQRTSGRIRAVAISPADPNIVLIGTSSGGIWRSSDGATTFVPVSDDQVDLSVASIVFAPSDPPVVYAGMGGEFLGSGVLKSTDGGATWRRIDESGLPALAHAQRIAVDPNNADVVLLAQSWKLRDGDFDAPDVYESLDASDLYQSIDGGRTWHARPIGFATDVAFDSHQPSTAYAAAANLWAENKPPILFRSLDAGTTWEPVLVPDFDPRRTMILRIAVSPAQPGRVYVYASGSLGVFFFVSDDHGETWREQPIDGIRSRCLLFEAHPTDPDVLYFGQYVDLFRSTDGGMTWTNLTHNRSAEGWFQPQLSRTHPDQFSIAFLPGTDGEFLLGNDGGLYRSSDGGTTFTHRNDSLSLTQIYGLTAHPRLRGMLFIGTQDNGLQTRSAADGSWSEFQTGDFGRPWIDPLRDDRVCANYYLSVVQCFTDYGDTFEKVIGDAYSFEESEDVRIGFLAPFTGNGVDRTLYFGTWRLFVTTDLGKHWTAPAGELDLTRGGFDVLTVIAAARSNPQILYTGSAQGRIMRTANGGVTWTEVSVSLPHRWVTSIVIDPDDADRGWVTLSGFRASHVFGTTDGGTTWNDLQADLPDIPVNALWSQPGLEGRHLVAGTDIGVFRSEDGGQSWTPFNHGLPPVIVKDFAFGPDQRLYAATHGRGVYAIELESQPKRRAVRTR